MRIETLLVATLLVACDNGQGGTQPLPPLTTDAGVPTLAAPTRTIGYRNPFGNVLQPGNLMVDGDFELTGRSDQAPWIAFNQMMQAQETLNYDTGGRCRSGVRCGLIGKGDTLIGYFSSPANGGNFNVRVYIQPETGHCGDAVVTTFDVATNNTGQTVQSDTDAPAADGWCVFEGMGQSLSYDEPALLVMMASNPQGSMVHVDEATVLPVGQVPVNGIKLMTRAAPDVIAAGNDVANWVRAHRKFGRDRSPPRTVP